MTYNNNYRILNFIIATVWFANGFLCKILNLVPRHEQIVARILSDNFSRPLIVLIGISEIVMAVWVLIKYKSKLNAITQITIVALMNVIEFIFVPSLLLWGRMNIVFAFMFIGIVYYKEFVLNKKSNL